MHIGQFTTTLLQVQENVDVLCNQDDIPATQEIQKIQRIAKYSLEVSSSVVAMGISIGTFASGTTVLFMSSHSEYSVGISSFLFTVGFFSAVGAGYVTKKRSRICESSNRTTESYPLDEVHITSFEDDNSFEDDRSTQDDRSTTLLAEAAISSEPSDEESYIF